LACLDQVSEWLDVIEATSALPADADASLLVARFAKPAAAAPAERPDSGRWIDALRELHGAAAAQARAAIRYVPRADSFFSHEDPVARIAAVPGLLALGVERQSPGPLQDLDPFACDLVITALVSSSREDAVAALGAEARLCEFETLGTVSPAAAHGALPADARTLLEAQLRLLAGAGDRVDGSFAAAAAVSANVLRHLGMAAVADDVARAAADGSANGTPEPLRRALARVLAHEQGAPGPTAAPAPRDARTPTLRIDAARIDTLVRLTGELIVAKNAIGHAVEQAERERAAVAKTLKERHAALDRLIGELQRSALGLRVLPLRAAFQRCHRLVRELAATLAKPAALVVEGEDTEADKAVVEALGEPLVHVLRNAMDHGIETAAVRAAAGKPPVATMRLRALRDGEHVLVEVSDDGAGIDLARVREVARTRGVATDEELAALSDSAVLDLIFAPGFSTATAVTEVSGRGVGMDAVRGAVRRLGGNVTVESAAGRGTTVRFTLPFSVMLTQVLTVEAAGQTFGIPLERVVETLRVPPARIFSVGAAHAIVLRDRTVPLVRLAGALGAASAPRFAASVPVVVADVEGATGALEVERVGERMEVMLKPMDGLLAGLPGIAGSTLLGDGGVLLVLDVAELLR
jgi:two-component system chemotaxis sensor kinase CheA